MTATVITVVLVPKATNHRHVISKAPMISAREMKNVNACNGVYNCRCGKEVKDHRNKEKRWWQAFLVLLVVYSAWSSPFELAVKEVATGSLLPVDLVVDAFFAIDIILTFFVAYQDKSTYLLVDDHKQIAVRYVTHLWFPMDLASTLPFQTIYRIFEGEMHRGEVFGFLNLLRLWRLRRVSELFSRLEKDTRFSYFWTRYCKLIAVTLFAVHSAACFSTRDSINEILRYASKNRLPEGLKEQMLAHMQLKFKTAELQHEEVLEDLPKAIRSSIAQHLFHKTIENTYLFEDVSEDLISQMVSEIKAEYFPPKVEIILQNEIPTDFYVIVSGAVDVITHKNGLEQLVTKLSSKNMFGDIGVIFISLVSKRLLDIRISQELDGTCIYLDVLQKSTGGQNSKTQRELGSSLPENVDASPKYIDDELMGITENKLELTYKTPTLVFPTYKYWTGVATGKCRRA
ncbi:potassium channel KAT3-like [Apium graveolens]|uniref:potassium channel KAT3-like n=1 Tax=Apium graveolens TaxID=4045 RepID=UPI003D79EC3F